ncbi:Calpain-8 [Lonchura striata]|uniref:Calpain-8 n=1 Tax=Lonchura striata TaxID=40157 RepID=A0A218UWP2_9PASE|nr:Calpain-8 [Lonchura striata domestica]
MARVTARLCQERAAADGLGSNRNAIKYLKQDYEALKQQCLQTGTLFKDEEFPACPSALGYQDLGPYSFKTRGIIWKRPTELCANPQFIIGGATRTDVCQGELGDCWLLAAIASLTLNPDILFRVVPKAQSFQEDYAGIFHFQFWQYGEWVDVVVDDRLPTKNGKLLFVHSEEGNEFWSALLEKAYAKLNGSYEALAGGSTVEGFEDFTGGISESYELRRAPSNLYQIIQKALRAGSLLGCSIDITATAEIEAITSLKLVKGHAYSITGAEEVYYRGRPEKLVRLRNPWGEVEWTGSWSDNAPEWNYVDPKQKQALDKQVDDGEFWMAFSDFQRQFSRLEICNLTPDTLTSNKVHKWDLTLFNGQWRRGSSAGGCQNYQATYWTNPQFQIQLDEPDDDHEGSLNEPCCTILVGLMQKNRRRQKRMGEGLLSIGYSLYQMQVYSSTLTLSLSIPSRFLRSAKIEIGWLAYQGPAKGFLTKPRSPQLESSTDVHAGRAFFARQQPAARTESYVNLREVSGRMTLPRGRYLIVPSTFEPYKNGEFCLRVFAEKQAKSQMMGDEVSAKPYEPNVDNKEIDDEFKTLFQKLSGEDCEVTAAELQRILNQVLAKRKDVKSDGFNINTCREMISLLDELVVVGTVPVLAISGHSSDNENTAEPLMRPVVPHLHSCCEPALRAQPASGAHTMALLQGHTLQCPLPFPPSPLPQAIYKKVDSDYSGTIDSHEMRNALREAGFRLSDEVQHSIVTRYACSTRLTIDFDGFVACMIRLETLFKVFHLLDKDKNGVIQISLPETIVCFGCAKCLQKLGVRSLEADAELLGPQRIWAQTQPQGLTGNQENVMALLHKSQLSPPGGGERMEEELPMGINPTPSASDSSFAPELSICIVDRTTTESDFLANGFARSSLKKASAVFQEKKMFNIILK